MQQQEHFHIYWKASNRVYDIIKLVYVSNQFKYLLKI